MTRGYRSKLPRTLRAESFPDIQAAPKRGRERPQPLLALGFVAGSRNGNRFYVSLHTRGRGAGPRVCRAPRACSRRVRVESVTTGAEKGGGGAREGERRVPARGIIALLQIIGQTPPRSRRARVPHSCIRICTCACVEGR